MDLVLAAIADHDANRHADLDVCDVGIDDVCRDFWTFFQSDDCDDVGGPFFEIRVIRLVKDNKGADRSPA